MSIYFCLVLLLKWNCIVAFIHVFHVYYSVTWQCIMSRSDHSMKYSHPHTSSLFQGEKRDSPVSAAPWDTAWGTAWAPEVNKWHVAHVALTARRHTQCSRLVNQKHKVVLSSTLSLRTCQKWIYCVIIFLTTMMPKEKAAPPLAAITWSDGFLCDRIRPSHRCDGLCLLHNVAYMQYLFTACWTSSHVLIYNTQRAEAFFRFTCFLMCPLVMWSPNLSNLQEEKQR